MDALATYTAPTLHERLEYIRNCPSEDIIEICSLIPEFLIKLPQDFLQELPDEDRVRCLRASLVCWGVTEGQKLPRTMQLRSILADQYRTDSLVSAGTGSGKTLPIAINILLDDPAKNNLTITISPLKRLQATQAAEFITSYGINTFAINEDTPRDETWWKTNIFNGSKSLQKPPQHLIVTVEQLFKSPEGHYPRIAILLRTPTFQARIARFNIDEAHFFYIAGLPLYGQPAFRPAWGKLAELKILLRRTIPWHLFSATFPPHILSLVKRKLLDPDFEFIHQTSNRPNTVYARHQVTGKIDDTHNYECFLRSPFDPINQPHVIIFVDDTALSMRITNHLDACLPPEYAGKGTVRHYHSSMSKMYLQQTHDDFVSPTGTCKILVATSGESVGVDFPNVKIVCTVGVPSTIVDALQRGGRAIRVGNETALFVIFYEHWALDVSEDEYMEGTDPDRPRNNLRQNSRVQERASLSGIRLIQHSACVRAFFGDYLDDHTETALDYTGPHCCDADVHASGFNLQEYLPGQIFTEDQQPVVDATGRKASTSASVLRPKPEREKLEECLLAWMAIEVHNDPCRRPAYELLSIEKMKMLLRMPSAAITSAHAITTSLEETEEWHEQWAHAIFTLISNFDLEIQAQKEAAKKARPARGKRAIGEVSFVNQTAEDFVQGSTKRSRKN